MKIEVSENREIIVKEVYNPITLESNAGETISICMRDSGFEFAYEGEKYRAQNGEVERVKFIKKEPEHKVVNIAYYPVKLESGLFGIMMRINGEDRGVLHQQDSHIMFETAALAQKCITEDYL